MKNNFHLAAKPRHRQLNTDPGLKSKFPTFHNSQAPEMISSPTGKTQQVRAYSLVVFSGLHTLLRPRSPITPPQPSPGQGQGAGTRRSGMKFRPLRILSRFPFQGRNVLHQPMPKRSLTAKPFANTTWLAHKTDARRGKQGPARCQSWAHSCLPPHHCSHPTGDF